MGDYKRPPPPGHAPPADFGGNETSAEVSPGRTASGSSSNNAARTGPAVATAHIASAGDATSPG